MANQRTSRSKQTPNTADARATVAEPAFWFGFEISWTKLALGRVVLFGLLAADALIQISHAPRYGAGGFNVAQLPGLDGIGPGRVSFGIAELVDAYLFVLIACGVATRRLVPVTAVIYSWLYFSSQLDSYQHHYLIALILLVACFVPWQRPVDAMPETRVKTWAVRLLLVELAIVYLWAAISKLSPAWFDGRTLAGQMTGFTRTLIDHTIGIRLAAYVVVAVELGLVATLWVRRAWPFAAPIGILFHLGIAFSGLEIGLFAWLMVGLYVFVVPDRVWIWSANTRPVRAVRGIAPKVGGWFAGGTRWVVLVLGVALGIVLAALCHFESALGVALVASIGVIGLAIRTKLAAWIVLAHVLALATWLSLDRGSTIAIDYYKYWGTTSRHFNDLDTAERAYRRVVEIVPNDPAGHFQLGRILLDRNVVEDGLAELHEAEPLDTGKTRAYVLEARWLAAHGRRDEAIAKARAATVSVPDDPVARTLLTNLTSGASPPSAAPPHEDRDP